MKKSLNEYPEYQSAYKKLTDMQQELTALDHEKNRIFSHMADEKQTDHLALAAQELLSGKKPAMPKPEDDRLDELRFREKVLTRAILIQKGALEKLAAELSRQICAEAKPEYNRLVANMSKAAALLREAVVAEIVFRDELISGSVAIEGLKPMPMYGAKHRLEYYINEAKSAGY
ncbi:MAG: hypothetical protein KJ630_24680 [Proteobacteria bacterium]|nr:hypothetical protein [Pseudomonadota bacterium]